MYWSLPRSSPKRTVQSFESVFIVITIILYRPSNWNALLAKIRWRAENCWRSKNKNPSLPQSTMIFHIYFTLRRILLKIKQSRANQLSQETQRSRLNQSIEALNYCFLEAQVDVGSPFLGFTWSANEAQREFLVLVEDAIRQKSISKSVQRFQLAIDEARVRLNFSVSRGTWRMPSNNYTMNNVQKALFKRLTVKFAGKILQDTEG